MAHRVFLRNLDQQRATKKNIALTFQEHGFYPVVLDQVQVVRSGGSRTYGRGWHCSAFVTLESEDQVHAAVSTLQGKVVPLLSDKPLEADRAVPRMKTLKVPAQETCGQLLQTKKEEKDDVVSSEPSSTGSVAMAVGQFLQTKKEDESALEKQVSSEPSATGSVAVAVGHFFQTKEEDKRKNNPTPWARRMRLRQADVVE